jgi:hypothetical protein
VVWPPSFSGGNEARNGLAGSSIVKTTESGPREAILKTHLRVGKARGLSMKLLDWELGPCEGIFAKGGSNED